MWRHIVSNFLTIAILGLVALAGLASWSQNQYKNAGPLTKAICLQVERGSNMRVVAEKLVERGAIAHPYIFKVGADYSGRADKLKAGSYLIAPGASMQGIVDEISGSGVSTCGTEVNYRVGVTATNVVVSELDPATNKLVEVVKFDPAEAAPPAEYTDLADQPDVRLRVTLAEGVTSWQVVDALSRADFLSGEVKDIPDEGMLAPQQYEVERGADRAALVARMQEIQAQTLASLWAARVEGLPYKTPEEALIMASIIEKETGVAEERGQVASVFLNRIKQGMKLQTDPTVIY
ncbi:MAG: endolytic transglycosylase MltG, partial [Albidovulum sp.]